MSTLPPPTNFPSWLDYAVATMDARGVYMDRIFDDIRPPTTDEIRIAVQAELEHLKQKAAMPWVRILGNWQTPLSKKLGRTAEEIVENNLLATDFSNDGVHVQFEDGTDLTFCRAFYVGDTPADDAIHRVAVFTEHCGYHEFWIGPYDRIWVENCQDTLDRVQAWKGREIRQKQSDVSQDQVVPQNFEMAKEEDLAWNNMIPVGREFGSPDYDRLVAEDAVKFASDLARWVQQCSASTKQLKLEDDLASDARNVQIALRDFGHDVSVNVAASIWIHYSKSMAASWMSGAETVQSAARTLYINCPRQELN